MLPAKPMGDRSLSLGIRGRTAFVRLAGLTAIVGCCAAVAGNFLGVILHDRMGLIDSTISDVAAG